MSGTSKVGGAETAPQMQQIQIAINPPAGEKGVLPIAGSDKKTNEVGPSTIANTETKPQSKDSCIKRFFAWLRDHLFCCFFKKKEPKKDDVSNAAQNALKAYELNLQATQAEIVKRADQFFKDKKYSNVERDAAVKYIQETIKNPEFIKDSKTFIENLKKQQKQNDDTGPHGASDDALEFFTAADVKIELPKQPESTNNFSKDANSEIRIKAKEFFITQLHLSQEKGEPALEYVKNVLENPEFQKNPKAFIEDLMKKRGNPDQNPAHETEEAALAFLASEYLDKNPQQQANQEPVQSETTKDTPTQQLPNPSQPGSENKAEDNKTVTAGPSKEDVSNAKSTVNPPLEEFVQTQKASLLASLVQSSTQPKAPISPSTPTTTLPEKTTPSAQPSVTPSSTTAPADSKTATATTSATPSKTSQPVINTKDENQVDAVPPPPPPPPRPQSPNGTKNANQASLSTSNISVTGSPQTQAPASSQQPAASLKPPSQAKDNTRGPKIPLSRPPMPKHTEKHKLPDSLKQIGGDISQKATKTGNKALTKAMIEESKKKPLTKKWKIDESSFQADIETLAKQTSRKK